METLDAPRQRSVIALSRDPSCDVPDRGRCSLPSINHLADDSRIKREPEMEHRKYSVPAISPSHPFPPPHSYSNHQSSNATSSVPGSLSGLLSPPESRRMSGDRDEKDQRPARQSLPSIHEALGGSEQSLSYTAPPPSAPVTAPPPFLPPSSAASPSEARTRAFPTDHHTGQGPPNPFAHPRSPFLGTASAAPPPPPPPAQADPSRHSFSSTPHHNKLPTLHPLRTTQSPPPADSARRYSAYPGQPASAYESTSAPQSAGSMNNHHSYGYSQYPSNYPLSAPTPSGPSNVYPSPSAATYSAPPRYPPTTWRPDNAEISRLEEKKLGRSSLAPYGESVKRHLESFDLEASLNEMTEGAGQIADFSKRYRNMAYAQQRMGHTPNSMPKLDEVDDMLRQSEKIAMSLQRMRDVVFNNQQASFIEPQRDQSHYRAVNGYDHDEPSPYPDEMKGGNGFPGPDPKKGQRRGVSSRLPCWKLPISNNNSALLPLVDVTAAIEQKPQNGEEALMGPGRCVMPAGCVSNLSHRIC
ncbi:hypothetical protein BDV96DRAFT_481385 [Lophiotrema nucula]|uniref:GATA-type domain-containing protein n=1 Tax=Lophiotrema nucula TaxID=690887 RepID=A0A6A5ZX35_9PLEO|nr:hypothetical protein BDV96DRAFT_481385 [Lophiotrema nucula]